MSMSKILSVCLFGMLALTACTDKTTDDTSSTADDSATTDDSGEPTGGFSISGTAKNLLSGEAATEGLCVSVADPTPALSGGELDIRSDTTVGAGGAYTAEHVETTSAVGLLMLVEDCAAEGTVMPTATGIKRDAYSSLGDGDAITDQTIYSIDATSQAGIQAGLEGAGYTGDLGTEGALLGFVLDTDASTPIDGAVVGGGSATVYYANADGTWNTTATVAAARSMFIIPGAPIYTYTCSKDGYTFGNLLAGSQPTYAVIVRFLAE